MIHTSGPAVNRASTGGLANLRFAPPSQLGKYPPAVPSDYTNIETEKIHVPDKKRKRDRNFLDAQSVSSNQFKAQANSRYQGLQQGNTASDFLQRPLAWDPLGTSRYEPELAGSAFENGTGQVAEMNNLDTNLPKMGQQFRTRSSFLKPDAANPFPVMVSDKFKIR